MDEGFLHIFLRYAQEISRVRASVIIDKVFESIQLLFLASIVWNSFFCIFYQTHEPQKPL